MLKRTLGVPIFQEQVMQLAIVAAGFSPGEADGLRRAMAAWKRKGGLEPFQRRLIDGMRERGYPESFAQQIFNQILGFGEYGFPESHAASFALLVYTSAWLKHYEPAAFCAALINSQPMGFYAPAQLVRDARVHGVEVRAVDVASSDWDCTLERRADGRPALRLGLRLVKQLSSEGAARLLAARTSRAFDNIADLAERGGLDRRDLEALAAADALRALTGHRHRAVWQVTGVERVLPLLPAVTVQAEAQPAAGVRAARREPGHRRRLWQHRSHLAPSSLVPAAGETAAARGIADPGTLGIAEWEMGADGGPGHHAPAARQRGGRHLRHHGG